MRNPHITKAFLKVRKPVCFIDVGCYSNGSQEHGKGSTILSMKGISINCVLSLMDNLTIK